jgi:hypothetical protein
VPTGLKRHLLHAKFRALDLANKVLHGHVDGDHPIRRKIITEMGHTENALAGRTIRRGSDDLF